MQNLLKGVPENVKQVLSAAVPFAIVVILFLMVGNFGISRVTDLRSQITEATSQKAALTQKLNILELLSVVVAQSGSLTTSALPDSNPSLLVSSQLKLLAGNAGMIISSMKSGAAGVDASGLSRVDISLTVTGARAQVIGFLKSIDGIAPVTLIDKIGLSETGGVTKADVSVKSYWAALPKTIPAIDQAITDLTADEKKVLTQIGDLFQPAFIQVASSSSSINPNPFGQ
jgi:hypothetical protein